MGALQIQEDMFAMRRAHFELMKQLDAQYQQVQVRVLLHHASI